MNHISSTRAVGQTHLQGYQAIKSKNAVFFSRLQARNLLSFPPLEPRMQPAEDNQAAEAGRASPSRTSDYFTGLGGIQSSEPLVLHQGLSDDTE